MARPDNLTWLDAEHPIYTLQKAGWERDERRLVGGEGILTELDLMDGETRVSYDARARKACYLNFARAHAAAVTGALRTHAPTPGLGLSLGALGDIRTRDKIDVPTIAELVFYNIDGIGTDGNEMPAWFDSIDERAQATGHRWLMVEMPELAEIRDTTARSNGERGTFDLADSPASDADVQAGFRPYGVEFSPLDVPNWRITRGRLDFAVIRTPVDDVYDLESRENSVTPADASKRGYYLLVRSGYRGLREFGEFFEGGGWWRFNPRKELLVAGQWTRTRGQIPLWPHYGQKSLGTSMRPAMSASTTMMLGQIGVGLMNIISARDYDFLDACASKLYFLGADQPVMTQVAEQVASRSLMIGVPTVKRDDNTEMVVQIYDGSMGAVASGVSESLIAAKIAEAKEESFQQVTSVPDSSGESKEAGYLDKKAPYLAMRAALRQQSEQTFIAFAEMRAGFEPTGFSIWPRKFDLTPLVNEIDAMFATLRLSGLKSVTLESEMILVAAGDRGLISGENREAIATELSASAQPDSFDVIDQTAETP